MQLLPYIATFHTDSVIVKRTGLSVWTVTICCSVNLLHVLMRPPNSSFMPAVKLKFVIRSVLRRGKNKLTHIPLESRRCDNSGVSEWNQTAVFVYSIVYVYSVPSRM